MAHRWMLALILICLTTLITAFRVRDLPKSSHDSAKRQKNGEKCDGKFDDKWHSDIIESDKYSNVESRKSLPEKQSSNLNKAAVESRSNEEQPDDGNDDVDFSFLNFKTGFLQEYHNEALNKLEEKLEIISKSFWNLFGDDVSNIANDEDGENEDDSDNGYDNENEQLKISISFRKSKVLELKKKTEIKNEDINKKPFKQPAISKVNFNIDGDHKPKIRSHVESKFKFRELKPKEEHVKSSIHTYKFQDSYISEGDDNKDNDDDYSYKQISSTENEIQYKDMEKKSNRILESSSEKLMSREKTHSNFKIKDNSEEKLLNKITDNMSKKHKTDYELRRKDLNKQVLHGKNSEKDYYNDGVNNDNSDDVSKDKYDEDSDEEDNIIDTKFSIKKTVNAKGTYKYKDIVKHDNLLSKTISKEIKDKETSRFISTKENKHYEDELTKNHTKLLSKAKSNKTLTDEKSSTMMDIELKTVNEKPIAEGTDNLDTITKHKNIQVTQKELQKREAINKKTVHNKTDKLDKEKTDFINEPIFISTSHQTESLEKKSGKQDKKYEEKLKKDTVAGAKKLVNNDDIKSFRGDKDKVREATKITKSSEITKENKIEGDLKKPTNKINDDKQKHKVSDEQFTESQEGYSKGESNLKHITDALHRRSLLKSEFEDFYTFLPTFAPNFSRVHNPECRRHGQIMLRQLRGTKLWALNSKYLI